MTKTFHLFKEPNSKDYFTTTLKKLREGDHVFHNKVKVPAICVSFVQYCINASPDKLSVTVSTDEVNGAKKVFITKQGFYRWYYDCQGFNIFGGVSHFAEEALNRLIPDALINGLDTPHPLWLSFK